MKLTEKITSPLLITKPLCNSFLFNTYLYELLVLKPCFARISAFFSPNTRRHACDYIANTSFSFPATFPVHFQRDSEGMAGVLSPPDAGSSPPASGVGRVSCASVLKAAGGRKGW